MLYVPGNLLEVMLMIRLQTVSRAPLPLRSLQVRAGSAVLGKMAAVRRAETVSFSPSFRGRPGALA